MSRPVRFTFEGREITAEDGQSIAGALLAAGVRALSWGPKYRRPRGYRCGAGACPGCTLRVDGLPGTLACMTPVRGGERVERIRPPLGWLPADRLGRLAPAGFQGSRLLRGSRTWQGAERVLAHLAGQAPLPAQGAATIGSFAERSVDVLVVGAGETGLRTAAAAAREGEAVLVVDRDWLPGGTLRLETDGASVGDRLAAGARDAGAQILLRTTAIGAFDDGVEGVVTEEGLLAVRAARTVHACGSRDREVSLPDGDRPGVMLASAVRRLVVREGVRPGHRAVLVESAPGVAGASTIAALLREAGVQIVARCAPADVQAIHGRTAVTGATIGGHRLACDLVVIDAGRHPNDELARQTDVPEEPRVG